MLTTAPTRAAIYIKEAAGYPGGENSKELQTSECENFCLAQGFEITTRYYDPPGKQAPVRLDDGRGHRRRSALRRNRGLQTQEFLPGPSTRPCSAGTS